MTRKWSQEDIKELIEVYEGNECLWNIKCADYRDRFKKYNVFEEIGKQFSCSGEEVRRKIHNLRNQVSQELKKKRNRKSGSTTKGNYESNWPYFRALQFVIPGMTASCTKSNLESSNSASNGGDIVKTLKKPKETIQSKGKIKVKSLKTNHEEDDLAVKTALEVLAKIPDDYDRFGEYVALELRTLRSDFVRRKLKNEIRKAIVCASDEDEMYSLSSVSSEYNILISSPPVLPENSVSQSATDSIENYDDTEV